MDGGQIDGQVINVSIAVGPRPKLPPSRFNNFKRRKQGYRPMSPMRRRRSPSPRPYRRSSRRSVSRSRSHS